MAAAYIPALNPSHKTLTFHPLHLKSGQNVKATTPPPSCVPPLSASMPIRRPRPHSMRGTPAAATLARMMTGSTLETEALRD